MRGKETVLREGDVFRWHYREPGDDSAWGRYHCCSNIAIVRSGLLRDTYWSCGSDGRFFGPDGISKLRLKRLGNLDELQKVDERNDRYYDDTDIVDLNHANSSRGNFYIRKGAKRSAAKMLSTLRNDHAKAVSDASYADSKAKRLLEIISKVEAGETDVHF